MSEVRIHLEMNFKSLLLEESNKTTSIPFPIASISPSEEKNRESESGFK